MYTGISVTFVVHVLSKLIIIISTTEEQEICVSHDQGLHGSSSRTHVSSDMVYLGRLCCSILGLIDFPTGKNLKMHIVAPRMEHRLISSLDNVFTSYFMKRTSKVRCYHLMFYLSSYDVSNSSFMHVMK